MSHKIDATLLDKSMLEEDVDYSLSLANADGTPILLAFRLCRQPLAEANDFVFLRDREKFDILRRLDSYPSVLKLTDAEGIGRAIDALQGAWEGVLTPQRGVYIFGAHKIGAKMADVCLKNGLTVKGFIDNGREKRGKLLAGLTIFGPDEVTITDEVVIVGSGRYSNVILRQARELGWPALMNMHELFFSLDITHGAGLAFRAFPDAIRTDAYRFISAFLTLDDERSRTVFDGLMKMRMTLDTTVTDDFKSPFEDEYLDAAFVAPDDFAYYADGGAFTGDTLERIEKHFGRSVTHAYMFEPELPAYYEGVKKFSSRNDVFFYNFGLSSAYAKFVYKPAMSYDLLNEINSPIPNDITSFIQAVRFDDVITGPLTLLKLDIEGAEASALRGAANAIRRHHPKLCICAYHRPDDLWVLIDEVNNIEPGYKIGLRHYSDIIDDTSLYFY